MMKIFKSLLGLKRVDTLTERTLKSFEQHKPVSKLARKLFDSETSDTLNERFARAREQVAKAG